MTRRGSHLPPEDIKEFLLANGAYDHQWPGVRCDRCDAPCKNERGLAIHKSRHCYHCDHKQQRYFNRSGAQQNFNGTKVEEAAKLAKIAAAQKQKPTIECEGKKLKNVFKFKYLGSIFAADGAQIHDIKRREALAAARCGQLRHCFDAKGINIATKLRIFKAAITSVLTYG